MVPLGCHIVEPSWSGGVSLGKTYDSWDTTIDLKVTASVPSEDSDCIVLNQTRIGFSQAENKLPWSFVV